MFFSRNKTKSNHIIDALSQVLADYFALDAQETALWCELSGNSVRVCFPFANQSQWSQIQQHVAQQIEQINSGAIKVAFTTQIATGKTARPPVTNIRNIIAVASGKGGVGKSTTSVNLAFALQQEGAKVGILDADIYGPSIPILLGNSEARPASSDNRHMQPVEAWSMVANSIGYLVSAQDAAIWRGPMASKALSQLINETLWPVLDYLIVDMPPGTGDVQITMAQQVPLTASVVVTTPQDLALADAQKGIAMFEKVNVPVLGLVENMSYYECSECGHRDYIFAKDGGAALAQRYNLPLLGALPLDVKIREHAGNGVPLLIEEPEHALSVVYREMARAVSMQLSLTVLAADNQFAHIKGDPIAITPASN